MKTTDSIIVATSSGLSTDHYDSLFLLYQPILKDGISVYLSLFSILNKQTRTNEIKLQFLIDILNCNLKDFILNKDKLEAVGLIKTYEKDNKYIIALKLPLLAKEFFIDTFFGGLLENEIGGENVIRIKKMLQIEEVNKTGYKDITKKFDEVFKVDYSNLKDSSTNGFYPNNKKNKGVSIKNNFDIDFVLKDFKEYLPSDIFLLKQFKDNIIKQAFLYDINENKMIEILRKNLKNEEKLDNELLINTIKNEYVKNNKNKSIDYSLEIKNLEDANINDIFSLFLKRNALMSEIGVINKLINEYGLENSYINYMLIYVFKKKDTLPSFNYLKKVIDDWHNKGLYNTRSLIHYLTSSENNNHEDKTKTTKKKKKYEDADWLQNVIDSI